MEIKEKKLRPKLILIIKDRCQVGSNVDSIKMVKVLFFHGGFVVVVWFVTTKACSSLVFFTACCSIVLVKWQNCGRWLKFLS